MELGELGCYLLVACLATTLLQHPASIVRQFVSSSLVRGSLMGLVMGATTIALVMSPWGKRSEGHFNPAITFTFYRMGKVEFWDGLFYVFAQLLGAIGGVALARYVLQGALSNHAVHYAVTVPGVYEWAVSGMSTNPARSFGPAVQADSWHALWIYSVAPSMGMLAAAETFLRMRRGVAPYCAKLHHVNEERCIFDHTPEFPRRRLYANTSR